MGKASFFGGFLLEADEAATILSVDVADRCREQLEAFACTYRVSLMPSQLIEASQTGATWEEPDGRCRVETEAPERLAIAELGRTGMSVQVQAAISADSFTQRCRFRWVFRPIKKPRSVDASSQ